MPGSSAGMGGWPPNEPSAEPRRLQCHQGDVQLETKIVERAKVAELERYWRLKAGNVTRFFEVDRFELQAKLFEYSTTTTSLMGLCDCLHNKPCKRRVQTLSSQPHLPTMHPLNSPIAIFDPAIPPGSLNPVLAIFAGSQRHMNARSRNTKN